MRDLVPEANVKLKRAYEPAAPADGVRILVDRLWPRGLSKADAALDQWDKDVAPSPALRIWFGHDPVRWAAFRTRYAAELQEHAEALDRLRAIARSKTVTLVYAAHDTVHTHALVLRDALLQRAQYRRPGMDGGRSFGPDETKVSTTPSSNRFSRLRR